MLAALHRRLDRTADIIELVTFLLDRGADVDGKQTQWGTFGASALFMAADQG